MEISTGVSNLDSSLSYQAGQEAAEKALKTFGGKADFLFIFDTPEHDHDQVLRGIKSITGNTPSAGCPAGGIIVSNKVYTKSAVAIMAFHFLSTSIYVEYESGTSTKSSELAENLSTKLLSHFTQDERKDYYPVLFLFNDNRLNNGIITSTLSNTVSPLCPVIGAGVQGFDYCGPYLNYEIKNYSVVSILFQSKLKTGIGVAHGWYPYGKSVIATRSEYNRIFELNGRPAFEVYMEIWSDIFPDIKDKSFDEIKQIFYDFAVHHPVGLAQLMGEYLIRDPYEVKEDNSICCGGEVPENSVLHFMTGNPDSLIIGTKNATRNALDSINMAEPRGSLYFDCITRYTLPDYNFQGEVNSIKKTLGSNIPIIGILSHGEIATPETGPVLFHNKTLAISVFSG